MMEEQSKILNSFVAGVSLKRQRHTIYLSVLLVVSLALGLLVLNKSVVNVRRKQLEALNAQIDARKAQRDYLENQIDELRRTIEALKVPPPEFNTSNKDLAQISQDPTALVGKFNSNERLVASNQLIQLYAQNKVGVIRALVGAMQPDEAPTSYRVNLYIVFTLARIDPFWEGDSEQLENVKALRESKNYKDPTFKKWVDESINRFRLASTPPPSTYRSSNAGDLSSLLAANRVLIPHLPCSPYLFTSDLGCCPRLLRRAPWALCQNRER